MSKATLPKPLSGIIPPMITPLKDRDTLDAAGLEKLIEHILGGGVNGLFILGTTGEAPSLSYRLRHEVIDRVCAQVAGRVPVLVGITDTSFVESVNLARKACDAGALGVVLATPYYFPAGQPELLEYLQHLAPELPLPMFLYNMPSHTKVPFEADTVQRAADIPNIAGVKDSSESMIYFHRLVDMFRDRPEFTVLVGPEILLAESVLSGGHGGICGGANICPRLYVDVYEAARDRDLERLRPLQERVVHLFNRIYTVGRHGSSYLKGVKCALSCLGICDDFMAEPFHRFRDAEREQTRQHLIDLGLLTT